jgi:hypothetical protein
MLKRNGENISVAKCALLDIEGLLNELDDCVEDTQREGVKDTVLELRDLISHTDPQWIEDNFPGWKK